MPLTKRFHHNRPPTILDAPVNVKLDALDLADPETPVGARGVGEPPVGAGYGAIINALSDALGDDVFRRTPVTPDIILASLELGHDSHNALTVNV
jgi:CO/xanthine dehydrogenase Mo-binding subunit